MKRFFDLIRLPTGTPRPRKALTPKAQTRKVSAPAASSSAMLISTVLACTAGLFLALFSDASPTGSSLDSGYRFVLGVVVVFGFRNASWSVLFVSSVIVMVFANSPLVLLCGVIGAFLTLGFPVIDGIFSRLATRRHVKQNLDTAEVKTESGVDDTATRMLWVAFVLTVALSDLADRWTTFSVAGVVGVGATIAVISILRDLAPANRRAAIAALGLSAFTAAALTGYYGWEAQRQVADIEVLRSSLGSDGTPALAEFDASVTELRSSLDRGRFRPLEAVPLAAQNVRSVRHLLESADEVIHAAGALQDGPDTGETAESTATLLQNEELPELCWALANFDNSVDVLSAEQYLVPKFRSAVVELDSELGRFDRVDQYCPVVNRLDELLGFEGKRTYLTLFMTTAEVRGIGGLVTNWALLEFDHAEVAIIDSGRSVPMNQKLAEVEPTLELPDDTRHLWGVYAVEKYFQDIGASPDGEVVASTAAQLFEQVYPDVQTDGVLIVGPKALAGFVSTVGEIDVGGRVVDAENTVDFLTREQYTLDISYGERVQMLEDLLDGVAGSGTSSGTPDPVTSLRMLGEAVSTGELMLIPNDPTLREDLEASPLLGPLPEASDHQLIGVVEQNFGLDKLDSYLERSAKLAWEDSSDSSPALTLTYDNNATTDLPEYVLGIGDTDPGVNRLRLASYAPVQARSVTVTSEDGTVVNPEIFYGTENGHRVSVIVIDTPPQGSVTVEFRFENWRPPAQAIHVLKPASINDRSISIAIGDQQWSGSDTARLSTVTVK